MSQEQLTPTQRVELLRKLKYNGGGYFRDNTIPKGTTATVVHAPEILEHALELAAELERVQRHLQNIYQDRCENAYCETSIADAFRQALAEVSPNHPALNGAPPSFGVWEALSKERDDLKRQVEELLKDRKRLERLMTLERGDLLWFHQEQDKRRALDVLMEDGK